MITVDCKDIPTLKASLAIHTSDYVGAMPALKLHEFVLAPVDDEGIDSNKVIQAIKTFLSSLAIEKHFAVVMKKDTISIILVDDFKLETSPSTKSSEQFFSCVHCGHVTQFETIHRNHMKIHYL